MQTTWSTISAYVTANWTTIRNIFLGAMVIFTPFIAAIAFGLYARTYKAVDNYRAA